MRRTLALLAAVTLVAACGDDGPTGTADSADTIPPVRAPVPIEMAGGGAGGRTTAAAAEEAGAADVATDMMIAPWAIEYVVGDGLPPLPTDAFGYVYPAGATVSADQVAALAAAFGAEGEPVRVDDGFAVVWRVGPDDGSAPSLWVYEDAQLSWNYSGPWAYDEPVGVACAASVDADGNVVEEDCEVPEPPAGVPTAEQAEQRVRELIAAIGQDPGAYEFETYADEWYASVAATQLLDGRSAGRRLDFGFGAEGVLQYAGGQLAAPESVGPYPLVDLDTALARLRESNAGWLRGPGGEMPLAAEPALVDIAGAESVVTAVDDSVADDDVVEGGGVDGSAGSAGVDIGIVEPQPGGVAGEPPADTVLVDPMPTEPMPTEPMPPEDIEPMVVTLVDVEADLWWVWDVDGAVWLVPAYRFIDTDGGWHVVPAVTDEYLVDSEPTIPVDTIPVDTIPVDTVPVETVPVETVPVETVPVETVPVDGASVDALAALVGSPLDEFTAQAEAGGWTVRVVEIDGESLPVTMDLRLDRINLAVATVDGVEQVVRATLDDGTPIGEPTAVPVTAEYAGVEFYPVCGNETLDQDGVTWYPVNELAFPDEYAAIFDVIRVGSGAGDDATAFAGFVAPGPGDDVGTLVVWADGVARFVSDSGDYVFWLVDDELTYDWDC